MTSTATVPPGVAGPRTSGPARRRTAPLRPPAWLVTTGLAALVAFGAHLLFVGGSLMSDEGGYAMVARMWHHGGPYLYGPQWVDRPPGLIALFWLADLGGPAGVRLTAAVLATALVAAAGWAGWAVRGGRAAGWSSWTAAVLVCSTLLETYELDGELAAAPWVMTSVAAVLHAIYRSRSRRSAVVMSAVSGAAAALAMLDKQNFLDGFVFAAVLLLALTMRGRLARPRAALVLAGGLVGAALVLVPTLVWSAGHGGVDALLYATYGFRADAADVMRSGSLHAPEARAVELLWLAVTSGLVLVTAQLALGNWRAVWARSPLALACGAAFAVEVGGIVAGANYWPHYLIAPIPVISLAAGVAATRPGFGRWWTRTAVVAVGVITATGTPGVVAAETNPSTPYLTGRWLAQVAHPGDSVVVPYSHANVIETSGLAAPYPYSWSLPVRTLDPDLRLFTGLLTSRDAPTWVVVWDDLHTWGLDSYNRVETALHHDYTQVGEACGHRVWLHRDEPRNTRSVPDPCGAETGTSPVARS